MNLSKCKCPICGYHVCACGYFFEHPEAILEKRIKTK